MTAAPRTTIVIPAESDREPGSNLIAQNKLILALANQRRVLEGKEPAWKDAGKYQEAFSSFGSAA